MLYPKEVGEHCSLLNLASNALLCIWSRSACRRGVGRRVYLCTSRGSCLKLCVCLENNLFLLLLLLFSPSSGIGSHCWEHSVIPGCQIFVCCWAGVQGVVPGDVGRDAVEEAHWENGQDRLPVEGFVREERMVRKLNLHLFCPRSGQEGLCVSNPIWRGLFTTLKHHVGSKLDSCLHQKSGFGELGHHLAMWQRGGFFPHLPHLIMLLPYCDKWDIQTEIFTPSCHWVQIKKLCVPWGNPKLVSSSEQKSFFRSGSGAACAVN